MRYGFVWTGEQWVVVDSPNLKLDGLVYAVEGDVHCGILLDGQRDILLVSIA